MGQNSGNPLHLPLDLIADHHGVKGSNPAMVRHDQAAPLFWNVLYPLNFQAEIAARDLEQKKRDFIFALTAFSLEK
jgi:hypothetical protein